MVAVLGGLAVLAVVVGPAWADNPTITPSVPPPNGANKWYVSSVTVPIAVGGDATSTTCVSVVTFDMTNPGPYNCSATDGTVTSSLTLGPFKIDTVPPTVTGATPDRGPNGSGWYNGPVTVTFAGSDSVSGIASCTKAVYSGPDSGSATVTGTCTNNAGLTSASSTFNLKYDATPPTVSASAGRAPDANGWYNHPVAVTFSGTDATSGISSCTTATYSGPDGSGVSVTGSCTDNAGNSAGGSYSLQYDATPPTVSASPARPPDKNGWYNHPVAVTFSGTDATSGISSCNGGTYSGPDSASASVSGTCTDNAGNTATNSFPLQYDASPPALKVELARPADDDGWYNHPIELKVTGSDPVSGIESCTGGTYSGPNSDHASLTARCTTKAGVSASRTVSFKYDSSPPQLTAALERRPDHDGWYNHTVSLVVAGKDKLSGIRSCSGGRYSGPTSGKASLTGTCVDKAGNRASRRVTFRFNDTVPRLDGLNVTVGDGTVTLNWIVSPDITSITLMRAPGPRGVRAGVVYRGDARSFTDVQLRNGQRYRYELVARGKTGTIATASVMAMPRALASPAQGAALREPPTLRWSRVAGASYYNVQLFFDGHKVDSIWPKGTSIQLGPAWTWQGHGHTLEPGRYRWYVWPGFGSRTAANYGQLLGGSVFVIK